MMTFRKIAAASSGKLVRAYFTENSPEPEVNIGVTHRPHADAGGRLTAYYTGRDSRATWRPDLSPAVAAALGIDPALPPKDADQERLFEAKRADTQEPWSKAKREISAYDLTVAPHKSVTLAAEFAATPAERAAIWHAIDRANDAAMRYVAREIGWARKGRGGSEGADPGAVAWVSFRHHTARPTLAIEDGPGGATYLADVPIPGDPHAHIHNALFNIVVTEEGRIGSLDTKRLNDRVHEFGAYFQARLADELRALGMRTGYDRQEQAVILPVIPQLAVDTFSKGRRQTLRNAKAYAGRQGLDWDTLSAERKFQILSAAGLALRLAKHQGKGDAELWRAQAAAIGWQHQTAIEPVGRSALTDEERHDRAYRFAARHLAKEFHTAAVIDHDKLRLYAARGLIGTGIEGIKDIDRVVDLLEERGLEIKGEMVALLVGMIDDKVRVTNTAQIRIEQQLAERAAAAARDRSGALSVTALRQAIEASELDFEREPEHGAAQKAAIYALGTGGRLTVLTGVAGSGKTTLLKPLVAAYRADTHFSSAGREVLGIATAWRQADALKDARIARTFAVDSFFKALDDGSVTLSPNQVLVIDEISQVAPRPFLKLLELQAEHGFLIKGLGDREQCQAIEAGDTIEILRRSLPAEAMPELLTTVRQSTARARAIAALFRDGQAEMALAMKREDGTAALIGGDQDQVVERIADLYMARRDILRAGGTNRTVTISALTNEDAADISRAVRTRLKARGEIAAEEVVYPAIDQRGETYDLPISVGDKVRLFRKTAARIDGRHGFIGSNGDVVEIVRETDRGLVLRNAVGESGEVEWRRLKASRSDRLLLGFGHALTIDAAQGITSGEHINALPRGTAGITAFKSYVAESRHITQVFTMISEVAVHESVKMRRALGDQRPIAVADLWAQVAEDMSRKPYKSLGIDLLDAALASHDKVVRHFIAADHRVLSQELAGRKHGAEFRGRRRSAALGKILIQQTRALEQSIARNEEALDALGRAIRVPAPGSGVPLPTEAPQLAELLAAGEKGREIAFGRLRWTEERIARQRAVGREHDREFRVRQRIAGVRRTLARQIAALDHAIEWNAKATAGVAEGIDAHLYQIRAAFAGVRREEGLGQHPGPGQGPGV
jgi:hypothetical protein